MLIAYYVCGKSGNNDRSTYWRRGDRLVISEDLDDSGHVSLKKFDRVTTHGMIRHRGTPRRTINLIHTNLDNKIYIVFSLLIIIFFANHW